jgi:hypothetical protein
MASLASTHGRALAFGAAVLAAPLHAKKPRTFIGFV